MGYLYIYDICSNPYIRIRLKGLQLQRCGQDKVGGEGGEGDKLKLHILQIYIYIYILYVCACAIYIYTIYYGTRQRLLVIRITGLLVTGY